MNILITGATGFLGGQLVKELLRRKKLRLDPDGEVAIESLTLVDRSFRRVHGMGGAPAVRKATGDVGDPAFVATLIRPDTKVVFHLAAMLSGRGERDFHGCLQTNLDGSRHLLEACRLVGRRPRFVFASSVAVFGGHTLVEVVSDTTKPIPQTTYGMTKLFGELLVNEYSRKGF